MLETRIAKLRRVLQEQHPDRGGDTELFIQAKQELDELREADRFAREPALTRPEKYGIDTEPDPAQQYVIRRYGLHDRGAAILIKQAVNRLVRMTGRPLSVRDRAGLTKAFLLCGDQLSEREAYNLRTWLGIRDRDLGKTCDEN